MKLQKFQNLVGWSPQGLETVCGKIIMTAVMQHFPHFLKFVLDVDMILNKSRQQTIFCLFNTNTLNFHEYFKDKLSSHQPSHMHNIRHSSNINYNTPLFHSKTQKCYLYQWIPQPTKFAWKLLFQVYIQKTNWKPPLSIPIFGIFLVSNSTVSN